VNVHANEYSKLGEPLGYGTVKDNYYLIFEEYIANGNQKTEHESNVKCMPQDMRRNKSLPYKQAYP
tara:strand:+ start:560 stop:757 length:198 start_codon:yes stop_codon:yes gene_type:complete